MWWVLWCEFSGTHIYCLRRQRSVSPVGHPQRQYDRSLQLGRKVWRLPVSSHGADAGHRVGRGSPSKESVGLLWVMYPRVAHGAGILRRWCVRARTSRRMALPR